MIKNKYQVYKFYVDITGKRSEIRIKICYKRLNKHNLYGWKNRFPIQDLKISDKGKWKNIIKKLTESVPDNVKILLKRYTVPVVINQYYRSYFVSNDKKFRITVDRYQKSFNQINSSSINISKNCDMSDGQKDINMTKKLMVFFQIL